MTEPTPLKLVTAPERERVADHEAIESMLTRATQEHAAGDLKALVQVAVDREGNFRYRWEGDVKVSQILGFLEIVKHDILTAERARPPIEDEPEAPA